MAAYHVTVVPRPGEHPDPSTCPLVPHDFTADSEDDAVGDAEPLAFAGLWEGYRWPSGEVTRSFCIITTEPNALMIPIHDRMPVVLEPADWPVWLGEADGDPTALLRPAADGVLRAWPISTRVNAPRNNTPDLLDELEPSFVD
jgi:putative SOS response-associated peptidase YedK